MIGSQRRDPAPVIHSSVQDVAENISIMSMLSLSKAYAAADASQEALYQGLRIVVKETRNWTHFISLIVSGATLFTFYLAMFRFRLIPRLLAGFGLMACISQMYAISQPLFGHAVDFRLIAPLGICQIVLGMWLVAKGFRHGEPKSS